MHQEPSGVWIMAYTTIDDPTIYFNTKLYVGNGSTQSITGVGFQPDWVWIKNRTSAEASGVFDVVRGVTKMLATQNTDAETTTTNSLTAFGSDGFSVGANNRVNQNTNNIVAWNWKAGGTASSNSDGSITSSVSANTTAGFSIVSYTGTGSVATVGHGLGVAPNIVIVKQRTAAGNHWVMYNSALPSANYFLYLDSTDAQQTATNFFNDTAPTSSVFTIGTDAQTNGNTNNLIAYCFAEKKGYSKMGSYTGNGNADGTFVYTGFKPAFVMIKSTSDTDNWNIHDSVRNEFNLTDNILYPNLNNAEGNPSVLSMDLLSQGFKLRGTDGGTNGSGVSYIYMAFAESPFVTAGTKAAGTAR
jgi:hypothetical protein